MTVDPRSGIVEPLDRSAPTFVGRRRELALVHRHLDGLLARRGSVVLIGGATGIGKTALVEALIHAATTRRASVLVGGCYDLAVTPPYGPWIEGAERLAGSRSENFALRQLLAEPAAVDAGGSPAVLFSSVRDCLSSLAAQRPLVVILEDIHWADQASLELFRRLSRQVSALPALLVATFRAEEIRRQDSLYAMLPLLIREAEAEEIDLQPLDDDAVSLLIASQYALVKTDLNRLVAYLQVRAEGNPFFLRELLRELEAEGVLSHVAGSSDRVGETRWRLGELSRTGMPKLVRHVLERRLDRFAEQDRQLLAVAAVIGQEVPLALWSEVARIDQEVLFDLVERVVAAHVLVAARDGATVRFDHALVREALYEGLLPPRRRVWHGRVAEALLRQPAPDPDAVGFHFQRAGDGRAAEWLVRAAERAQAAYAWLSAAERYEAALAQLEAIDAPAAERARLLLALAQLRRYTWPERGVAHLDDAERLARLASDAVLVAAAQFDRGHLRCMAGDYQRGLAEMKHGLAGLESLSPSERARAPSLAVLGVAPGDRERYHRGVLVLFESVLGRLAEARSGGAPSDAPAASLTARELLGRGWVHAALGEPDCARQAFADARLAYGDQHWEVGTTYFYELDLVVLPFQTDRLAERRNLAEQAEAAWRRASGAQSGVSPRLAHLPLLVLEGQWTEARELALTTLGAAQGSYAWRRYPARFLGWLAREQGDADLAWECVRAEFPVGPATQPGATWFLPALELQRLAAALSTDAGDLVTARAWLEAHDRWLEWSGALRGLAEGQLGWADWATASGHAALARQYATMALSQAACPRQPLVMLAAHRLLGELATASDRYDEAEEHLSAALELAHACTAAYDRALTLLSIAELRRATGQRQAIEPLLADVTHICSPLGARRALARAAKLAPRRTAPIQNANPHGLTGREIDVLVLIATGSSNQEIADQLVLSVRTVERHINSLYRKIDARGRADAVAYAARHGLLPH